MLKCILLRFLKTGLGPLTLWALLASGAAHAQTTRYFNQVFAFDRTASAAGVTFGTDGALYGSTYSTSYDHGGLIFRTTVDGSNPQTLYQLKGDSGDGYSPRANLLLGSDGYFYGTTHFGPRTGYNYNYGSGTVFRLAQDGTAFTTVYVFAVATDSTNLINADGMYPDLPLIEGEDGYLYGVTTNGGQSGTGTVFRVAKDGAGFQTLHQFTGLDSDGENTDGAYPSGKLLFGADGRLYGVTSSGGEFGRGVVYSLGIGGGSDFAPVYYFSELDSDGYNAEGVSPVGALVEINNVLYGVTAGGGTSGYGTVYSLTLDGTLEVLHTFLGGSSGDAASPAAGLILAGDGRLYGTTSAGSYSSDVTGYGTVFAIATDGSDYEILHTFNSSSGSSPKTELVQATNAETYYGTASGGGSCGYGNVFRLSIGALATQQSDGHNNCESTDSGGGSMGSGLLLLLAAFGLAPSGRRRWHY